MRKNWKKHLMGFTAIAVVFMMIGAAVSLTANPIAQAENTTATTPTTTVVTSPFTSAIAAVKDSVVGVRNYQTVRYSNNSYGNWGSYFGYGYGNGNGNDSTQTQEVEASTGSGVVISAGYVLTNYHVVEGASSVKVTVANAEAEDGVDLYDATVVAYDENVDVAVLNVPDLKLAAVTLGDSDTLQVGDWAICIGNPLGESFSGTVTAGIVSALDRGVKSTSYDKYGRKETTTNTMIQTDAAINSGNSGGGMFSVSGELMGIPTLKYSGSVYSSASVEGIGMCIPINAAKPLIEDVLSGKVTTANADQTTESSSTSTSNTDVLSGKPRMGITITSMNPNSTAVMSGTLPNGVYVSEVEAGAPAEAAGMQAGDIIVDVDGNVITSVSQLQSIIAEKSEGDTLAIKVWRVPGITGLTGSDSIPDGEYVDLTITLAVVDQVKQ